MNVKKTILVLALFFINSFCMVTVQAQAASVKETVYEYQRVDNYRLGKKGRITGWKWEKKKQGLFGTKYRWGKRGKAKKTDMVKIQHPYIKEMGYGDEWYHKPGVYCGGLDGYMNTRELLARQSKKRMYFILYSQKGYSYLVTRKDGSVLYAGRISLYEIDPDATCQNISDIRVMGKNKLLMTYQINDGSCSNFAKSGICCLNVKTGQKQFMTMDTETYYPLLCDGNYILGFTAENSEVVGPVQIGKQWNGPEIVLLSCKSGKMIRKISIPDTKLPKEADETNSKQYKVWICGGKVYYLDNIGGIYVCKVKGGEFKRIPGKYRYVKYNYPMNNYQGILFKKGKKTVFCVDYLTYGKDEHFNFGEKDPYSCIVRYDIS